MESLSAAACCSSTNFTFSSSSPTLIPLRKFRSVGFRPCQFLPSSSSSSSRTATLISSVLKTPTQAAKLGDDEVLHIFLKERELNGDFISKVSDTIWLRGVRKDVDAETSVLADATQLLEEPLGDENEGGFLKLTKTNEWLSGGDIAPVNRKPTTKELRDDRERRKRLNLLKYEALKRELFLLTVSIGTACSGYCLVTLSVQAAVSYATGVLFSCLYLQLLYQHADNLSKEKVPQIFMRKKTKKIGIRSQDLEDLFERLVKGSSMALSSSRLVIPAAIYGLWELSQHFANDFFDFQLVPAMVGIFAYKAAALVQVYRDNEDLQLIFPDNE